MAMVKCKECGVEISSSAKACPHCGKKRTSLVAKLALGIIGLSVVMGVWGSMQGKAQAEKERTAEQQRVAALTPEQRAAEKEKAEKADRLSSAQSVCEDFVKKSLHDPASAEFGDFRTYPVKEEKQGLFHVQVHVRARNGFNAVRAMTVDCRTKRDEKGNWSAVSLKEL